MTPAQLRNIRTESGLSQSQLARLLDISAEQVADLEEGRGTITSIFSYAVIYACQEFLREWSRHNEEYLLAYLEEVPERDHGRQQSQTSA